MDQLRTPLELVNEMDRVLEYSKRGTKIVHELRTAYLGAKNDYLKASLTTKAESKASSAAGREDEAQLANFDLFVVMTARETEYQYARDKLNDLERELSKLQTESRLVQTEMNLARGQ